jgi:hypothetical protein
MLEVLVALPRQANVPVTLAVNEALQAASFGESLDHPLSMPPDSSREIVGHANIERAVSVGS